MAELRLKQALLDMGIKQAELARGVDVSTATISLIAAKDQWPKSVNRDDLLNQISFWIQDRLAKDDIHPSMDELKELWSVTAITDHLTKTGSDQTADLNEIETMLSHAQWLSPTAKRHFGLTRDPFRDDVEEPNDVFLSSEHAYAIEAMKDAILGHRFVAVVGESGSGKTVMRRLFLEQHKDAKKYAIIQPYILDAEDNEKRGKPLRGADIQESIIAHLAPGQNPPSSRQAKMRKVDILLKQSAQSGRRNLLLIEEAHTLPIPTLRQLKRLQELEDGMSRILGILLIGQPELNEKLDIRQHWEAREVIQRCEIANLRTLDQGQDLEAYLTLKFSRLRKDINDMLDKDAPDALRTTLQVKARNASQMRSYLYPLAVNNLLAKAMNLCAEIGKPKVGADQIRAALGT